MDIYTLLVFPGDSVGKESACNAGDMNSIPRSGSFPGGRHDNPLHCSCLENPMEWGAWWTIVHRWQRVGQDWSNWAHIYSLLDIYTPRGLPGGWAIKRCLQCRRHSWCRFNPWIRKISWNMKWQSTPVLLPGKFYGQRNLAGYSPWDHKRSATIERLSMRTQIHVDTNTDLDKTDVHIYMHIYVYFKRERRETSNNRFLWE